MQDSAISQISDTQIRKNQDELIQKFLSGQLNPEDFKPKELSFEEKAKREQEKKEFLSQAREKQSCEWTKLRHIFLGEFGRDPEDMTPEEIDLHQKIYIQKMENKIKCMEVAFGNVLYQLFKKK